MWKIFSYVDIHRCSIDVSTHDNVSYDIATSPASSKDHPNNNSNAVDSKQQDLENEDIEELQLYEIPDLGITSTNRDAEESYIYY